jgi:RNA polymerase sigma-70 factor, ECF subfamily
MPGSEPAKRVRLEKRNEEDERRLVEAAQRDVSLFADLYEKYFELVYSYVARRIRERAATEDLTSEVFRKALAGLPRFKWTGAPFAAWLIRIASNMIADRAKRAARASETSLDQSGVAERGNSLTVREGAATPSLTHGLLRRAASGSAKTQQSDLEDAEGRALLFRLVDELPDDQKRVVALRFAEEKSIKQIAAELGRSEGAVKQLQFRALENLRKKFTTEDTEKYKS